MSRLYYAGILLMLLFTPNAHADGQMPWLPNILSDHMVLQQGQPIPVWGRDLPGRKVAVDLAGQHAETLADATGAWKVLLPKLAAGGPYDMTITGSAVRTINDVLVGELWLGGGQSNMELAMRASKDRDEQLPLAADSQFRFFNADRVASVDLQDDVRGAWVVCSPATARDFSAVAYHFGRSLRASLGVPVGMIVSCWGGTPAEDWTPRPALDSEPALKGTLAAWDADLERQDLWKKGRAFELFVRDIKLIPKDPKAKPLIIAITAPRTGELGGQWFHSEKFDSQGNFEAILDDAGNVGRYSGFIRGGAWGSALCQLSASASVDLSGFEAVEFNFKGRGTFIPTFGQPSIKDYDFYAAEAQQAGAEWKTVRLPLATFKQGGWGEPKAFTPEALNTFNFSLQVPYWPDLGALTYNAMIHPLTPLPLRGAIWYQGESNAGRAGEYQAALTLMIKSWREAFHAPELPFYIVQLPGYADGGGHWAALRDAQRRTAATVAHSGLVSTLDLGESRDIHPKDKRPVGERLGALALSRTYGKASAPLTALPGNATVHGKEVRIDLKNGGQGLELQGDGGFELAGEDGIFHSAVLQWKKDRLNLSSAEVTAPKKVRHAWSDDPSAYTRVKGALPLPTFELDLP